MKLTNHHEDNSYTIDTFVMRGTIEMTCEEYKKAHWVLVNEYKRALRSLDTYTRDSLASLEWHKEPLFCLGVTATSLLAKEYSLTNYKAVNYGIKIV